MVQLSESERALVDDFLDCIAEAVTRLEEVNPSNANKTKLQKLLYLGIDEFDVPITYSWYLAGAVLPEASTSPADLAAALDQQSPEIEHSGDAERQAEPADRSPRYTSAEELVGAGEPDPDDASIGETTADFEELNNDVVDPVLFTGDDADDHSPTAAADNMVARRRDEIVDFYVTIIPDVWEQNTMRFLQNFYLEHAPPEYQDLYVQSTHLRTRLRDLQFAVQSRLEGSEPAQPVPELVREIGLDISDLHVTIRSTEQLSATFDEFVRGTDAIEDGLMMLSQRSPSEFSQADLAVVQSIQDFYYYYVWRYPCLVISRETARGPSADSLREQRTERFAEFETEIQTELESLNSQLSEAGLQPDFTDYPDYSDDVDANIGQLADQYFE